MTFGGNTRQRVLTWAAVAFLVLAILCAIESGNTTMNPVPLKLISIFGLFMGCISIAGVWAAGLPKAEEPNDS